MFFRGIVGASSLSAFGVTDWKDVRCVGWFAYIDRTGAVLRIPKRPVPGKKQNSESALATDILSHADVIYKS